MAVGGQGRWPGAQARGPAAQGRPLGYTPRRDGGLSGYERVLARAGLAPVAGRRRGWAAGRAPGRWSWRPCHPEAVQDRQLTELADSKALTAKARNVAYRQIMDAALDWSVVIDPAGGDRPARPARVQRGRDAPGAGRPGQQPGYVLTDGFPVRGLAVPALAMWKGDQVAACVAAASIIAKVTRDALMCELHRALPGLRILPA